MIQLAQNRAQRHISVYTIMNIRAYKGEGFF